MADRPRKGPQAKERGERRTKKKVAPSLSFSFLSSLAKERASEQPARKWAGSKTPSLSSANRPTRSLVAVVVAVGSPSGRAGALRHSGKSQKLRTASRGANDGEKGRARPGEGASVTRANGIADGGDGQLAGACALLLIHLFLLN